VKIHQRYLRRKPRRNFTKLEERRRRGMDLLSKGFSQAEVARRCRVSETTSFRWKQAWLRKGPQAWKRGRLGRPPKYPLDGLVTEVPQRQQMAYFARAGGVAAG